MIADSKPYPAYRDSGIPWLGDVPEHWEVRRLGQVGVLFKGSGGSKEDEIPEGVPCIRYGQLYTTYNYFIERPRSFVSAERAEAYTPIRYGDVLFAGSGETIDEIGKSAVNLLNEDVRCGGDVIVFRPSIEVDSRFLGYATDCRPAAAQKATMGRGITVMHIYGDELKRLAIPLPLPEEQAAIVRYLDHADRRIRRYIRAKQRLIALLEEQKQAIIHQAVTRGLDPTAPMKPSGVEWLGDIPAHWEVRRLRSITRIVGGMTPSMGERRFWDGTVPWVTPKDMKRPIIGDSLIRVSDSALDETSLRLVPPPAVLMVVRGMILARRVPIALTDAPVTTNQDMKALIPVGDIEASYLAFRLQAAHDSLTALIDEAGHGTRRLPTERWQNLELAIPPRHEQTAIAEFVEQSTSRESATQAGIAREIDLLREYRTRLIADVVTGKLDVREAAARLPIANDEPEPLDDLDAIDELEDGEAEALEAELEEAVT